MLLAIRVSVFGGRLGRQQYGLHPYDMIHVNLLWWSGWL